MKEKTRKRSTNSRWTRDVEKENYWKTQIVLWQKSGLSVRAFCQEHGVIESSFYAWRRELIIRARETGDPPLEQERNHVKDGRGRTIPVRFRQTDRSDRRQAPNSDATGALNPFVAVSVVPDSNASQKDSATGANCGLTITTPAGYRISISGADDLSLLKKILAALEES